MQHVSYINGEYSFGTIPLNSSTGVAILEHFATNCMNVSSQKRKKNQGRHTEQTIGTGGFLVRAHHTRRKPQYTPDIDATKTVSSHSATL